MSMDGVLRLYFGESNLPTPAFIVDAAVRALREGQTFYSENAGLPSLRREIAGQYRRLHDVELDPDCEIVVTASGVQALHLAIRSVVDPGDEVVILSPAWPNSTSIVALSHGVPIDVPLALEGERYRIDFRAARGRSRPTNPADRAHLAVEPPGLGRRRTSEQRRLLELCRDRGIWLLADEVYERIFYAGAEIGDPAPSILRLCDRDDPVHVVQSFSKSYCMTGWRVGWLVTRTRPRAQARPAERVLRVPRGDVRPGGGADGAGRGRGRIPPYGRLVQAESRLLRRRRYARCPASPSPSPTEPSTFFPRVDGLDDSFRFLPPAARRTEGRPRSRLGVRRRRRGFDQALLRSRPFGARAGARTARPFSHGRLNRPVTRRPAPAFITRRRGLYYPAATRRCAC